MIEVGRALKERTAPNAMVMGCAGMARHRRPLEDALGIPVIDPTQAAVTMAIGAVQLRALNLMGEEPAGALAKAGVSNHGPEATAVRCRHPSRRAPSARSSG